MWKKIWVSPEHGVGYCMKLYVGLHLKQDVHDELLGMRLFVVRACDHLVVACFALMQVLQTLLVSVLMNALYRESERPVRKENEPE